MSEAIKRTSYDAELQSLSSTYESSRIRNQDLVVAMAAVGSLHTRYVASGGALAAARLAADLHLFSNRTAAWATTPLRSIQEPAPAGSAFVLFSTSGKNPDAAAALAAARAGAHDPVLLISRRSLDELPSRIQRHSPTVLTIPSEPDGFLATRSLLAVSTALVASHGHVLPPVNAVVTQHQLPTTVRRNILVLYGWGLENVAIDIETRLHELGIGWVQLADYRNFAHGRHVGLARNLESTTVIALIDPASESIAESTVAALPTSGHVVELRSLHQWPISALELLAISCQLPAILSDSDPAKPKVPVFGRKLYNLPIARMLKQKNIRPVDRKLATTGTRLPTGGADLAFEAWLSRLQRQAFAAIVLDYDGTCCTTEGRFEPPPAEVQAELLRLLDIGIHIGFASGRGKSLPASLRSWIPERLWPLVHLALYNGSVFLALGDDVPDQASLSDDMAHLAEELRAAVDAVGTIDARSSQLTVRPTRADPGVALLPIVRSVLARHSGSYKAWASAHSVDVIETVTSKALLLHHLEPADGTGTRVLAVGDQGGVDGNDFELLASTEFSLSVDRVSPDLTRCWNLDMAGESGPALLVRYLRCLRRRGNQVYFHWGSSK